MKVANIAISPWAKLTTRRAVDEHERERERGVDAAGREPAHDLLEEVGHRGPASVAEVGASHGLVGAQLFARALEHDTARPRARRRGRPTPSAARVLLDEENGQPCSSFSRGTMRKSSDTIQRREPERRLVQQQQPRPRHERPREREHLLLAAGQRAGRLVPALARATGRCLRSMSACAVAVAARVRAEAEVLAHVSSANVPAPFGHVRHARARATASGGPAEVRRRADLAASGGRCPRRRGASWSCRRRSRRAAPRPRPAHVERRPRAAPGLRRSGPRRPRSSSSGAHAASWHPEVRLDHGRVALHLGRRCPRRSRARS